MKELTNLRKEREKHFLNEDGTFTAKIYNENVHYLKNGIYHEIDNTLITENNHFTNKANNLKTEFAKSDKEDFLLKISNNQDEIKIDIEKKKLIPEISQNRILYANLLPNIDIKYEVIGNKVKDTI